MRFDLLAALCGVMIAIQSRVNGELSHRLNNGLETACISFGSGLVVLILIALANKKVRAGFGKISRAARTRAIPRWRLGAGVLGGLFIAIASSIVPLIGVAIYSVASIAGQTAVSLVVDRMGITGGGKAPITARRLGAAIVTVIAVLISVWDRIDANNLSLFAVLLAVIAGAGVGVQRALNGQINEFSHQSFATSLLNFINGTAILFLMLFLGIFIGKAHLTPLPAGPWWLYTGGTIGVIYIAFTSTIVQHVGVLTFTLFSVGGQLLGSLILDALVPTQGAHVTSYLITGIVMTYLGVIVSGLNQFRFSRK
jgi:transporter family-2 protein